MTNRVISEAQSKALYERERIYTEAHRNSYSLKMERTSAPDTLRELVHVLRKAYADEVPSKLHSGAVWVDKDTGEGSLLGSPGDNGAFAGYLYGSDYATDRRDEGTTEVYLTPFRACMAGMSRSSDEATRRRAAIVGHVTIGNTGPVESAMIEGVSEWCAKIVAKDSLAVFWRRLSDIRLDLRRTETAA